MKAKIKYGRTTEYFIDDRPVTKEEFDATFPTKPIGRMRGHMMHEFNHPLESLAVHPDNIAEAVEYDSKHGVPTDYDSWGRPIMKNRAHQKNYLKIHGVFNKDGSYGD